MIILGESVSGVCCQRLVSCGCAVVRFPSFSGLPRPVASHPDLLFFQLGDVLYTFPGVLPLARSLLASYNGSIRAIPEEGGDVYPLDVPLSALLLDGKLFGRTASLSAVLRQCGLPLIPVRQGYARCACAVIAPDAVITSDAGMARILRREGIDVLTIRPGFLSLPGYDTGLIGGCGGLLPASSVFPSVLSHDPSDPCPDPKRLFVWFGSLSSHPDGREMTCFAASHGTRFLSLSDEPLFDGGGLIVTDM